VTIASLHSTPEERNVQISLKRKLAFGTAALAVVAFGGGAYAAAQESGTNDRQAFLNDVAKRLKVTPNELTAALQGAFSDQLDAAVAAGRLTQAQANQIRQRIQQRGGIPFGGRAFAPGRLGGGRLFGFRGPPGPGGPWGAGGPLGPGGPQGPGGPLGLGGLLGGGLDAAASYLGLSTIAVHDQLVAGKSLAEVATARHKSVSGLEGAILAAIRTQLGQAVAAKQITAAQQQKIVSRLSAGLGALVNRTGFGPRFGPRGFLGHTEHGAP
jgi:hypothetical protein